ncbi:MAG: hypothetical protein J5X22_07035 [Candidatus Accumulibacter sp.]|uniref:Uncharacterized protein n=2 Tax=Candidatus Accumulibacter TaxID=327159 RepID=A0A7D5SC00_9PROT|nr:MULTISPECIES: hypothetical protein [Candidatus Accumulibacter]MBL8401509.1 hypothetical protein [Accumulibacter sp.]MBN8517642.1 hypothetical protein [Accumulibacter sp.]MBO3710271.1 hypothetical protein [Accumulibacter sp.]MCM8579369.1 hypothetical protein [Accumulibacter sp.]MCM8624333.1 hypothetical protein [Accumulibacter sp.]
MELEFTACRTSRRCSPARSSTPGEAEAILCHAARFAWTLLLARIDEVFPLV